MRHAHGCQQHSAELLGQCGRRAAWRHACMHGPHCCTDQPAVRTRMYAPELRTACTAAVARVLYCGACLSMHTCQYQIVRMIPSFLKRTNLCESALWKHKAMLAGQRSLRGLRRWSRRGERCTHAQCPWHPGAALRPFPRPTSVTWCLACLCWRSCDSGKRRRGGGDTVLRGPRRACLHLIDAGRFVPRPFHEWWPKQHTQRTPRIACDWQHYQQWRPGEGAVLAVVVGCVCCVLLGVGASRQAAAGCPGPSATAVGLSFGCKGQRIACDWQHYQQCRPGRGWGGSAGGGGRGQGEGLRSSVLRPLASTLRVRPPPPAGH